MLTLTRDLSSSREVLVRVSWRGVLAERLTERLASPPPVSSASSSPTAVLSGALFVTCRHVTKPLLQGLKCKTLTQNAPNFASYPPYIRVSTILHFYRHKSGQRDKPTILNTSTKVVVWNGNVFYLAAPIPILPNFR